MLSSELTARPHACLPRMTTPQDLGACSSLQMAVLYHKARTAFQNVKGLNTSQGLSPLLGEPRKIQGNDA